LSASEGLLTGEGREAFESGQGSSTPRRGEPEASGVIKDTPPPTPRIHVAIEELVEVIKTPPVKRRKLTKVGGTEVPVALTGPQVDEAVDVAKFLASWRKKVVLPPVLPLVEVEKFIANEPVLAVPVVVAKVADKEPLRVPEGSIPILSQPLGSNIQHILEEIEMMSDDSVEIAGDNMGASPKATAGVLGRTLSPILETGNSSRALTPKRPQSSTPTGVEKEMESRRSKASEASEASSSESTVEIQPEGANWIVGGKLAKLGGDFKSNPFKAVVDLVDHEGLQLKRDITLRGVAEEMLTMQCLVSINQASIPTLFGSFY
jgi:hypothetical protein